MKKKIRGKGQIIKQKQNTILSKMFLNSIQIQRNKGNKKITELRKRGKSIHLSQKYMFAHCSGLVPGRQ